jgi:hypothetical protein
LGLPEGVRQVIERRLVRLSDESHRVLAHSSVLGHDLSLPIVAAITGNDEALLLDLLDEALGAGLLRESAEGYAFAHPLIQEALSQELSMRRRRSSVRPDRRLTPRSLSSWRTTSSRAPTCRAPSVTPAVVATRRWRSSHTKRPRGCTRWRSKRSALPE